MVQAVTASAAFREISLELLIPTTCLSLKAAFVEWVLALVPQPHPWALVVGTRFPGHVGQSLAILQGSVPFL